MVKRTRCWNGRAGRGRISFVLGAAISLLTCLQVETARAACNLIPVAGRTFGSTKGSIDSPITSPGDTVEIALRACDGSPGFEPMASDNLVTLTFQPPGPGSDTDVPITVIDDGLMVDDCNLPGGRCSILRFTTPSTTDELAPHGLAGPARIMVTDPMLVELARIDALFAPTNGCDAWPDRVFGQFTVLPPPNLMADLVGGVAPEILATVDGGGNLLVPFDHWGGGGPSSVLAAAPGATVAILLDGSADIPAQGAGDTDTILQVLSQQPNPERWVRSFTLDGRPLPPLIRLTAGGQLFGTADAETSVLRFQRNDGEGGPDLYDLSDRLDADRGPIRIDTYAVDRRDPLPLISLRSSPGAVGYVRSEASEGEFLNPDGDQTDLVAQVVDVATGTSTPTGRAVARVGEGSIRTPAVLAGGNLFAFLESEGAQTIDYNLDGDQADNMLRVYSSDGVDLTGGLEIEADTAPLLDRRTLAISGGRVFFRTPGGVVQTLFDGVGGVDGLDAATDIVISPDGLHVYTSAYLDVGVGVFARDAGTGVLTFVELEPVPAVARVDNLALSSDGKHLYVRSWAPDSALTVFERNPVSGMLTFVEQHVDDIGGVDGLGGSGFVELSPDGANVYVASGGADDEIAVFSRDSITGMLTFIEAEPGGVDVESLTVSPDGANLYATAHFDVRTFERDVGTGALTVTQVTPTDNPRTILVSPDGRQAYVGGGYPEDIVLFSRDPVTGALTYQSGIVLPVDPDGSGGIPASAVTGMVLSPGGGRLYVDATRPLALERDADAGTLETLEVLPFQSSRPVVSADGRHVYWADWINDKLSVYRPDVGLAVFDADSASLRTVGIPATRVAVAGERALFLRPEEVDNSLLNADPDSADFAAQLLDSTGVADVLTPLGVSARRVGLSENLIALVVSEGSEGDVDRNDDDDTLDTVLAVADVSDPTDVRHVGIAADAIAIEGSNVVFSRPEWMEKPTALHCKPTTPVGGCDLNGNGNASDRVLHVYRHTPGGVGSVENVRWQVSAGEETGFGFDNDLFPERPDTVADGHLVAFFTDEPATLGVDLNNDFDTTDLGIVQFLNLSNPGSPPINSGLPGLPCNFPSCEPALPFRVDSARGTVSFVAWEALAGVDLDGNGSSLDFVLNVYNLQTGAPQRIPLFEFNTSNSVARLPENFLDGQIVYSLVNEVDVGVDLNGDGIISFAYAVALSGDADDDGTFDDFDTCIEEPNPADIDADADDLGDTACDPNPKPCPPVPQLGCTQVTEPGKGKLQIRDNVDDSKDVLQWNWNKGGTTDLSEFGDPVVGFAHYSFCVYDASSSTQPIAGAVLPPGGVCDPAACWSRAGKKGFKRQDKAGSQGGITRLKLGAGAAGKAKMLVKGKGGELSMPSLPLSSPVLAQLVVRDGDRVACWDATYSVADDNDGTKYKATSD